MSYRFFAIPARAPDEAEQALNAFCAGHRVIRAERQLVVDGAESFWAVCVTWLDGTAAASGLSGGAGKGSKVGRVDYRETLPEADFAVYAGLRVLRKQLAEQEGVPGESGAFCCGIARRDSGRAFTAGRVSKLHHP